MVLPLSRTPPGRFHSVFHPKTLTANGDALAYAHHPQELRRYDTGPRRVTAAVAGDQVDHRESQNAGGDLWKSSSPTILLEQVHLEQVNMSVFGQMNRAWRMGFSCQGVSAHCFLRHPLPFQKSSGVTDEMKDFWETYILLELWLKLWLKLWL